MLISRRQFLRSSAVVATGAAVMPTVFANAVSAAVREQASSDAPMGNRTLVIVQMKGGNDGLNSIVPFNDPRYYDLRPTVNVAAQDALPLDGNVGFNPSLASLKTLWDEGILAIVEGVGYPKQSYSHFESMDIWQTGDVDGRGRGSFDGWLGKYLAGLDAEQRSALGGMAIGRALPRELSTGQVAVPIVESVDAYRFQADPRAEWALSLRTDALLKLYASTPGATPLGAVLDNTIQAAQASSDSVQDAHAAYEPGAEYPDTRLGRAMRVVAEAVAGNLGVRVAHVVIGGFDTHAGQLPDHGGLLSSTADAMLAFYRDMQAHGLDRNVVMMTWSEFGRRATENASGGTDHGSAGPMFLAGTPITGGRFGEPPSLTDLDRDNFRFTVDFRSVYATALEGWLGAPAELILGSRFEQLPLIRSDALAV